MGGLLEGRVCNLLAALDGLEKRIVEVSRDASAFYN